MTYGLDDITIIPAVTSDISSRSECNVYNDDDMLPLITAPMSSLMNDTNWKTFRGQKINTIIPRNIDFEIRKQLMYETFIAISLVEFQELIDTYIPNDQVAYWCVDIANGHMTKLLNLCSQCKDKFGGTVILMTGNIANPDTYLEYAKAGIDFVRCSIGSGSACITSANSGCHMPMASLIKRCVDNKWVVQQALEYADACHIPCIYKSIPYIIADGGFDSMDKIIKALALGADYVMLGKILSQTTAACGVQVQGERVYYGMSTKRAQVEMKTGVMKTSEGVEFRVPITGTLEQWTKNFIHYLQTAMSYTNSKTLVDFKNSKTEIMSHSAYKNYYK